GRGPGGGGRGGGGGARVGASASSWGPRGSTGATPGARPTVRGVSDAPFAFDRATAVARRPGPDAVHDVAVDPAWTIGDKPNGGYLLAMLAPAGLESVAAVEGPGDPHPLAAPRPHGSPP